MMINAIKAIYGDHSLYERMRRQKRLTKAQANKVVKAWQRSGRTTNAFEDSKDIPQGCVRYLAQKANLL